MTTSTPRYDAVVVGARAAGAATAMLLARAGLSILVVDRSRYGSDTLSTHALMRGGVVQLHRWGLLDAIVAAGTPPVRRTSFLAGRDELVLDIAPSHGVDALYAPRRTVLDRILVDAAEAAGAHVRFGMSVADVRRSTDGRVTGVVARDAHGRRIEIEAGTVIGADGMRSTIADLVAAPIERIGTNASALVYGYWRDLPTCGYEWIFRNGVCAGLIPTNDGMTCVFACSTPDRVRQGGARVLEQLLQAAAPAIAERVAAGTAPSGVRNFGGRVGHMRRASGDGWALVGDSGYWKDPVSAHGLTDALRDAELLARAIVHGTPDALPAYQATRDRLSTRLFDVVDLLAGFAWDDDTIGSLLIELSRSMAAEVDALAALDEVVVR